MVMPGPIEMRMPAVTRIDILERSGDDLTGEMCIEEHSIEGPEELVGGMSGLLGSMDISDRSFPFTLQPSGRSDMAVEFGGISIGGGNAMTSQGLSQYFIPWPEKPIEAGESWTDSTTQESAFGESGAVSITIVTHYTYLGLVESETGGAPAHTVQARAEGSMAGNTTTAAMGMDVEMMMTSTWTGESEYRFDPRDGLLDEGSTTVTMEMTLDFVAPMTMSMPMSMTSTTSTRRRR